MLECVSCEIALYDYVYSIGFHAHFAAPRSLSVAYYTIPDSVTHKECSAKNRTGFC